MKQAFFIIFLMTMGQVWGQSAFLKMCSVESSSNNLNPTSQVAAQISWLKLIFQTKNCNKLMNKINSAKSFSEIIPARWFKGRSKQHLPFKPIELIETLIPYDLYKKDWDEAENHFGNLELFSEFRNLTHIIYEQHPNEGRDICETLKQVPSIDSVSIASWELREKDIKCIIKNKIKIYYIDNFRPHSTSEQIKNQIYGISNYLGNIEELYRYRKLSYLGLADYSGTSSLRILAENRNLTHLHLNIKNVKHPEEISHLGTLRYLSLNCYNSQVFPIVKTVEERKCESNYLTNIDFLKSIVWLKGLDLSWNNIQDITPVSELKHLEFLNLRMNKISNISPLEKLIHLKFLDLVGNKISAIPKIKKLEQLTFLNLSYNQISNIGPLSDLENIIFLGLGNNPIIDFTKLKPMLTLKVLSLDGNSPNRFNRSMGNVRSSFLSSMSLGYEKFLPEMILFEDIHKLYRNIDQFYPLKKIDNRIFEIFKNVEVLSISDNLLVEVPDLSRFNSLKYLDLSNNFFDLKGKDHLLPHTLEYLNLKGSFSGDIQDFPNLENLKFLDFGQNDMEL